MYNTDYTKSRKEEIRFENYLKTRKGVITENSSDKGCFNSWDISITSTTKNDLVTTYEVKYNSNYSNNTIAFEIHHLINDVKVNSGLSATAADYYILTLENDPNFYMIETEKLRELCRTTHPQKFLHYDKNNYLLAVFNKDYIIKHFTVIIP